jgi:hypothetical protein
MANKYIVWIREDGKWVEQGDGPLTQKDADRIAREVRRECRVQTKVCPAGLDPNPTTATVTCKFCEKETPAAAAHIHQGGYVGECCWDERLRVTE